MNYISSFWWWWSRLLSFWVAMEKSACLCGLAIFYMWVENTSVQLGIDIWMGRYTNAVLWDPESFSLWTVGISTRWQVMALLLWALLGTGHPPALSPWEQPDPRPQGQVRLSCVEGGSLSYWVGVCCWHCETLTLFKRVIRKICDPIEEYSFRFGTLFNISRLLWTLCHAPTRA